MNHGVVFPRIAKDSPRHLVYSVDSCDWLPSDSECDGLDGIFHSKACQTNVRVFKTQKSRSMELVHELTALRTLVGPAFIASLVIPSMTRSSWRAGQGVRGCNIMNTTSRTPAHVATVLADGSLAVYSYYVSYRHCTAVIPVRILLQPAQFLSSL
ncbi:hypothetical protein BDDG_04158 [Blastomyces dermatitidis ATCC 18188]|uniref:Uncharacterized protein n=1 Tax=Ajellomyces dermatitidis (strain ATCC 18188 / CBS 674.68) TaxID=653446 RepID=F2TDA6_AJEDA|nr:hypothetical protein BDDG_04158 [Blastomyces dermatitidis ATCC 18188]